MTFGLVPRQRARPAPLTAASAAGRRARGTCPDYGHDQPSTAALICHSAMPYTPVIARMVSADRGCACELRAKSPGVTKIARCMSDACAVAKPRRGRRESGIVAAWEDSCGRSPRSSWWRRVATMDRRRRRSGSTCARRKCVCEEAARAQYRVKLQQQWMGLRSNEPIHLMQAPGDDRKWYVWSGRERCACFRPGRPTTTQIKPFAQRDRDTAARGARVVCSDGVHPSWPTKHEVYLSYTRTPGTGDPSPVCRRRCARS